MGNKRTIAVTGATGFVGRSIVRTLRARDFDVKALARDAGKAREVLPSDGVRVVVGDVLRRSDVEELVRDADACIHLVGIIRERGRQTFKRMHVDATRNVVEACEDAGVGRYVHMSALGPRPDAPAPYARTKYEGERLAMGSGLDWTIFRPGLIHGPDGEFMQVIRDLARGDIPPYFFMPYFVRSRIIDDSVPLGPTKWESATVEPVSVEDVARCFVEALDRPETIEEIYSLTGSEALTYPEMYDVVHRGVSGAKKGIDSFHVPATHARAIAFAAEKVGVGGLLPFDVGQTYMAVQDATADCAKARAHLDFDPVAFTPTFEAYAHTM